MKHLSARDMTRTAVGIALIAVCSWISVPTVIPFTLQTFAVCLVCALLGGKLGALAVLCYVLLGAAGAPVFSGFRGGVGVLLGPTGGYIAGFLLTAPAVGFAADRLGRRPAAMIPVMAGGVLLCYAFGTAWFMVVSARGGNDLTLPAALSLCVFPYLIPDGIKIVLAALLARRLHPLLPKA